MVLANATLTAGEALQDAVVEYGSVGAAVTFSKGDVLVFDGATDLWIRAATGATGDFAVAAEDAVVATATKKVRIITGGRATVVADGAIAGGNAVMMSGATAGQVIEYTAAGTVADIDKKVGWYSGKETGSDRDGVAIPAAADGDVIIITLRGRGGRF